MEIIDLAPDDARWAQAFEVLRELRTHLTEAMLTDVLAEGTPQGLRFTAVFDGDECIGVAGWRLVANTSAIRKLYVDDLVTRATDRSRGAGALLLADLESRARAAGCTVIDLDSGVEKHDAHRFYLRERMHIRGHHFTKVL